MKRMAPANAPDSQPAASERPMFLDRLHSIFGTGGVEPAAVADEGADCRLIEPNEKNHNSFHEISV